MPESLEKQHNAKAENCTSRAVDEGEAISKKHCHEQNPDEGYQSRRSPAQTVEGKNYDNIGKAQFHAGDCRQERQEIFHIAQNHRQCD